MPGMSGLELRAKAQRGAMQYSDHLYYNQWKRQDADSSDESGRGRVPKETVGSSTVARNAPSRTEYVSKHVAATSTGVSLADSDAVKNPAAGQAARRFARIIGTST